MPDSSVSSCVLNILGSFSSSLGLYKKLREKRRRKRRSKKGDSCEEEELRLSKSLRQGPEDISQEYQRSIYAVGDQFAIGDGMLYCDEGCSHGLTALQLSLRPLSRRSYSD